MQENKPVQKFKAGAVHASIWENQREFNGASTVLRAVKLERRYKDKDGNWKSTTSLNLNDIPKAALVLTEAYKYLATKQNGTQEAPEGL